MSGPVLEARQLVLTSGSRVLQRGIDLLAAEGQVVAVVGESGTGRRALFRTLAGLEPPAEGEVYYGGEPLWSAPASARRQRMTRLGVFLAGGALLSTKTLLENVALPLEAHTPLAARDVRSLARLKLALAGLAGYENHYPSEVDLERRVRAALARATALDPEVLLLEQPTVGLDSRGAALVRDAVFRARDDFGAAVLVISNDLALVRAADEAVFLDLETRAPRARGNPSWLRDHAAHADVRAFLSGPLA